ncbi:MAG: aromatic ring-hydroxylating dioxygenase subunit alpha [Calothrix sp. MO_167.B12]|nr:aromatic ring-hydroxylating dioxygenase subunit alpha [Calothrix sp. MO_167.B12]
MDVNYQPEYSYHKQKVFNHPQRFIEGWYWTIHSRSLKKGKVKSLELLGREIIIYRSLEGQLICCDAYCPHMGAHLGKGIVEGDSIRCSSHGWKFDAEGICVEVPCLGEPLPLKIKTWPVEEKYGLIWVWTGKISQQSLPYIPELELQECASILGASFVKNCHPNVVMINAIDAHRFNTINPWSREILFDKQELNHNAIQFHHTIQGSEGFWWLNWIRWFYKHNINYNICYWYGSIGIITIGPECLQLYIMFALRLLPGKKSAIQPIFITKKRSGIIGIFCNHSVLFLTKILGMFFMKGNRRIVRQIPFNFQTPTRADLSIIQFIQHINKQKSLLWRTWQEPIPPVTRENNRDILTND